MKRGTALALLLLCTFLSAQTSNVEFVLKEEKGKALPGVQITTESIPFVSGGELLLYDKGWRDLAKAVSEKTIRRLGEAEREQKLITETPFFRQSVEILSSANPLILEWKYEAKPHAEGKYLQLRLDLEPGMLCGYAPGCRMPSAANANLRGTIADYSVSFTAEPGKTYLSDLRNTDWKRKFQLVAHLPYDPEKGGKGKCRLEIRTHPASSGVFQMLDIAAVGNRGLRDDVEGDGKGGWTDQGSNDLRNFRPGLFFSRGIPFRGGEKAVVLQSRKRPLFPERSPEIMLGNRKAERLHFCHTVAWGAAPGEEVFRYIVRYADGTEQKVPVRYGREGFDWFGAKKASESVIAWKGFNGIAEVGLHHARWTNPAPEKEIRSIQVESCKRDAVPVVLAVTAQKTGALGDAEQKMLDSLFGLSVETKEKEVNTADWYPCLLAWKEGILPGSVLDLSSMNHKPAGKYGFLKEKGDSFEFEKKPGTPIRFWGTNVAIKGPFLPKRLAPGVARTLAAQGVNLVRLHLYGAQFLDYSKRPFGRSPSLILPDGTVNMELLDRMEFFIAELKKNGIYIYMDWNDGLQWDYLCSKSLKKNLPKGLSLKNASLFDPELIAGSKKFAKMVFQHKNPYTGLRMVDDPVFAMFEITNENTLTVAHRKNAFQKDDPYAAELAEIWRKWQIANGVTKPVALHGFPESSMGRNGRRFFAELQRKHYTEMYRYLRELGIRVPICGTNWAYNNPADPWSNQDMDFLGDHGYYSYGGHEGKLDGPNGPSVVRAASLDVLPFFHRFSISRIEGKPNVISEWNFNYPGRYRCEGVPLMSAFGCFQNWNGLIFYCMTGSFDSGNLESWERRPRIQTHSQHLDPSTWGFSQAASVAYRRGDFRILPRIAIPLSEDDVFEHRRQHEQLSALTAMARVSLRFQPGSQIAWPFSTRDRSGVLKEAEKRFGVKCSPNSRISAGGELKRFLNPALVIADSPRSAFVCGDLSSMRDGVRKLHGMEVVSEEKFASLTFTSLDGRPLTESARILVTFAGDSRNKGAWIKGNVHNEWGSGPALTQPVSAKIRMKAVPGEELKCFVVEPATGKRLRALPVQKKNGLEIFSLGKDAKSIYFELIREKRSAQKG